MSDFKNKLIEKYTEYFIKKNPSNSKDDQATTDFCNEKLDVEVFSGFTILFFEADK